MTPLMRVAFSNLGCKLNQAELENLARRFAGAGHEVVAAVEQADLHVVNSCTVTVGAARDSRKTARRGHRLNGELRTVLTGCYVESDREQAAALAGVDLVVPNSEKDQLLDRVHAAFPELRPAQPPAATALPYLPLEFGNARALVKIEDGCDMQCAFCIIPSTRGHQRSRRPSEIIEEVSRLAQAGFPEIVLTGVQISSYRSTDAGRSGSTGLFELTARLLDETPAERLRLSSIAPWEFDPRLLDLFASGRLCRHFHLSLQSGCDATLRRMRRPYSTDQFASLLRLIRERAPRAAMTTDVIVGFPGETEEEHRASLAFVAGQSLARIHAFPYSERPGTAAAAMPGKVAHAVVRERMREMLEVARSSEVDFTRLQVGETVPVLWESHVDGFWRGTSDNYLRVVVESSADLARRLGRVELARAEGTILHGAAI